MTKLTRKEQAIINAMKYLSKHDKTGKMRFTVDAPNSYSKYWKYSFYIQHDGYIEKIQRLNVGL